MYNNLIQLKKKYTRGTFDVIDVKQIKKIQKEEKF